MTGGLPPISLSWQEAPWDSTSNFIFLLNTCGYSPYVTSSLKRGWVLFTIASAPRQHSHSQVQVLWDLWPRFTVSDSTLSQPGGPGPCIYISQEHGGPVIPQALGSLFVTFYYLQGYGGGVRPRLHMGSASNSSSITAHICFAEPLHAWVSWDHLATCL
jgi:hypothetical protein